MAVMTTGNTSRADLNRRRILDVALAELLRDPDASMDQIARAAGVVRRTVYGHFPSREALISTLVDDAVEALAAAHAAGREGVADPAEAVARSVLSVWRSPTATVCWSRWPSARSPCRASANASPPCGRTACACSSRASTRASSPRPCPRRALAYVHEQILFALMEAVNDGLLSTHEAGRSAAVTVLTAAGVPAAAASALVTEVSGALPR